MMLAEKYQNFLQIDLQNQIEMQKNNGGFDPEGDAERQQAAITYQVEQLGMNMKLVLSLIPQEVIDNYSVMSPQVNT